MSSPAVATLLQQAMSGDAAAQASLNEALAQHEDPRVRMIAEWTAQQRAAAAEQTIDVEPVRISHGKPEKERMVRKIRALARKLDAQREIGDTLAAALGACYLCWGEDPDCGLCQGEGAPSWKDPDPDLFRLYVLPAVKRYRQNRGSNLARQTGAAPISERSS